MAHCCSNFSTPFHDCKMAKYRKKPKVTLVKSFTKIDGKDIDVFLPNESIGCWFADHKLRLSKNEILGIRGSAIGNTDNHPEYYLTMRCVDCNKNFGTIEKA